MLFGHPISFTDANYIFRVRTIQTKVRWNSPMTWFKYPIAYVRWGFVSVFGGRFFKKKKKGVKI